MSHGITIALDAMGGDAGSGVVVPAAVAAIKQYPDVNITLVGDETELATALTAAGAEDNPRLKIQHASQRVEMDDLPSNALRNKKDSSMRVALNLVKDGHADACVSAGNTGALMATSRFVLKMLPGGMGEIFLNSMRAEPAMLKIHDYEWEFTELDDALQDLL